MPIDGVLLDLAGVVYERRRMIPGAEEAIANLRAASLPIRFVTNTTRSPKQQILSDLADLGMSVSSDEIFTPVEAARQWLEANSMTPHVLVHPAIEQEFSGISTGSQRAVIIGDAATRFDFDHLNEAFRELIGGARLLALAKNRSFKDADGQLSLDAGPFVAALEYATGKEALILGKPSPTFYHAAIVSMSCMMDRSIMVGDDAEADVAGALAAGIGTALLVRTGKYLDGDEARYDPTPTATVADLFEAAQWILAHRA